VRVSGPEERACREGWPDDRVKELRGPHAGHGAEVVANAITGQINTLPEQRRRSLT